MTGALLARAEWSASRSSGRGGQRRDKVATRAELTLTEEALTDLPEDVADRLRSGLRLDQAPLRITVQEERMLARNREIAEQRLLQLVTEALAPPPPPRRRTRPTRAATEDRLMAKVRRSRVKRMRQPPETG